MTKLRTHIAPGYTSDDFVQVGDPINGQAAGTFTTLTATADLKSTVNNGTAASVTGLTVTEHGTPYHHVTEFTFSAVAVNVTHGGGTDGYGTLKIYDFPAKAIGRNGTRMALTAVGSTGGVNANATFLIGLGHATQTTANSGNLVSNGDTFGVAGGSSVTLSSGAAGAVTGNSAFNTGIIDGVGTARALYINLSAVDTASSGTVTLTGTVFVTWASF